MANVLYDTGRQAFLQADVDWLVDTIKIALIDTGTVAFSSGHDNWDDVSAAVVGTPQTLGSKSATNGVADAADPTFTAVTGATVEALIIYKDTGTPTTSTLIAFIDTGTGLPVTPNGGDIIVVFDSGANKIFKL